MPLPKPEPGLVLCYEFLWSHEADAGEYYGKKKRPSVIVLSVKAEGSGAAVRVTVAPITHLPPRDDTTAVEIPPKVKQHLGLDNEPSWIVCDELNEFAWLGLDLYPVPGGRADQFDYGLIPPLLYDRVRDLILKLEADKKRIMDRDD